MYCGEINTFIYFIKWKEKKISYVLAFNGSSLMLWTLLGLGHDKYHAQGYQKRIARASNKKVKLRNFKEGDLVLKVLKDETFDPRGKMKPRWSGPFIIMKIMSRGAIRIIELDGEEMLCPINMNRLRKYHIDVH